MNCTTHSVPDNSAHEAQKNLFIFKLYDILEDEDNSNHICWDSNGSAVLLKDPMQILEKVLPKYFSLTNYNSFIRQLCFYGFKRVSRYELLGKHIGYSHPQFCKGSRNLLDTITRKKSKSSGKQQEKFEATAQKLDFRSEEMQLIQELGEARRIIGGLRYENDYLKRKMEFLMREAELTKNCSYNYFTQQVQEKETKTRSVQQHTQPTQYHLSNAERESEGNFRQTISQHSSSALIDFDQPRTPDFPQELGFKNQEKEFDQNFNSQEFEWFPRECSIQPEPKNSASLSRKHSPN